MYTENTATKEQEFDVNNPALGSYVPDEVDPNANPVRTFPPPPDDGVHIVVLKLDDRREGGPVYLKGTKIPGTDNVKDAKLVAKIRARFLLEDGTEGGFLKDWFATSVVMQRQKASSVSGLCYLAGRPFTRGALSLGDQKAHLERLFAEAGEEGIRVKAKTRWNKSYQKVDPETGLGVWDGDNKVYEEIKGQAKIKKLATLAAMSYVQTWEPKEGQTPDAFQKEKDDYVAAAADNAHLFVDPVSGEDRQVQCEIDQLVNE